MLVSTGLILECIGRKSPEHFRLFNIYGELRIGKSAYAIKTGVEALLHLGYSKEEAYEKIKEFIIFHPQHFFDKLEHMEELGLERLPFLIWDDAGLWLYALEWRDPFIIQFVKELNVIGTKVASILFTAPSPVFILRKIRQFPASYNVRIYDISAEKNRWAREAKGYKQTYLPSGMSRVRLVYSDRFSAKLPDDFYNDWYKPLRDSYELLARNLLKEKWEELRKRSNVLKYLEKMEHLKLPPLTGLDLKNDWEEERDLTDLGAEKHEEEE